MSQFFTGLATGFLLGAIAFGIFALLLLAHRQPPPSITKHARREQTVDVHYTRQYRDAREPGVAPWNKAEAEGIDYRWINLTGEEK